MASMIVSRRALSPALLQKLRPVAAGRFFNTNALRDERGDEQSLDVDRRPDRSVSGRRDDIPSVFGGVFDPFFPTRSLGQMLNMVDQMMENPFVAGSRGMRRDFDVREDNEGLYIRVDMPGLGKEHMKVSVEQDTLVIRGEGEKESDEEEVRRYRSRIDLPPKLYKTDQIKAEMKNGVLKVLVPKVKPEERSDVVHVNIE